jgi:hypothetical protein
MDVNREEEALIYKESSRDDDEKKIQKYHI